MAGVPAVFVDGVGGMREMAIECALPWFRFLVARQMSASYPSCGVATRPVEIETADFEKLGELPDGRVVYTQIRARLKLWRCYLDVVDRAQRDCPFDIAERELKQWMQAIGLPAVRLYHRATPDRATAITRHHFEGVGREIVESGG